VIHVIINRQKTRKRAGIVIYVYYWRKNYFRVLKQ